MAEQKKRNPRFVTPKGVLVYPHVVTGKPDTKYVGSGVYHTYVKMPEDAELFDAKTGKSVGKCSDFLTEKLDASFEKFSEEHNGKKKKGKVVEVTEADPPFYIDEGELFVKTKLNAYVEPTNGEPFTQAPALFDAKGKPTKPKRVWNGTIAKVAFEVVPYFNQKDSEAGITLRLKAIQIIELSTGGDMDGGAFGFGQEEGYEDGDDGDDDSQGFDEEEGYEGNDEENEEDDGGDF
ncbi:hypothetical protein GCM10007160_18050 [Litchfieldella qijiaojingensis]|uniref:Uncharacterized protein n=1 Tax=Litchfieldella qijiaojingensis TaxID=980347 RepID=A0ABQ2YPD8_9GAMM|nr:hypothetical protein [Halomonas qijiaojingensis]GGX90978.1 hypothetical protein GCM10007160_18050 [Halomonas qijiaojingensis]